MYVQRNIEAPTLTMCSHGQAISVKYYEGVSVCVCARAFVSFLSGMQIAPFLRRITLPSVSCLALPHFPTLYHKSQDFFKHLLNIKCVL